jgi:hypothetical protein
MSLSTECWVGFLSRPPRDRRRVARRARGRLASGQCRADQNAETQPRPGGQHVSIDRAGGLTALGNRRAVNDYSGINSCDSESLRSKLPDGMKVLGRVHEVAEAPSIRVETSMTRPLSTFGYWVNSANKADRRKGSAPAVRPALLPAEDYVAGQSHASTRASAIWRRPEPPALCFTDHDRIRCTRSLVQDPERAVPKYPISDPYGRRSSSVHPEQTGHETGDRRSLSIASSPCRSAGASRGRSEEEDQRALPAPS